MQLLYTEEQEINTIHGKVDLDIIKEVKKSVKIPVIGNGDIRTVEQARKMFEYTNVDGIMIGRGCIRKTMAYRRYKKWTARTTI